MILTEVQKANYERDGFLIYGSFLTGEGLEALRERIDALAEGSHPNADKIGVRLETAAQRGELERVPLRDKVWQLLDPHRYDEVIFDHARNPKILDIVAELFDSEDIKLANDISNDDNKLKGLLIDRVIHENTTPLAINIQVNTTEAASKPIIELKKG